MASNKTSATVIFAPIQIIGKNILKMLPVLRGFSRNAKQDSVANAVSGGMASNKTSASVIFAPIQIIGKNILKMLPRQHTFSP
jgi:hypothetical protein